MIVKMQKFILGYAVLAAFAFNLIPAQQSSACIGAPNECFVRNSQSCQHWFFCRNQVAHPGVCPQGFNFNARDQTCDENQVDCTECSPWGSQSIPAQDSCQTYFRCANGHRTVETCPQGLMFNPATAQCDPNFICQIPTAPPPTTTPNPGETTTGCPGCPTQTPSTEDPWQTTTEDPWATTDTTWGTVDPTGPTTEDPWGTTTDDPWGTTQVPPGGLPDCTGAQRYFAHPTNCSLFYRCENTTPVLRECPPRLHWNQFITACDDPASANCVIEMTFGEFLPKPYVADDEQ